MPQYELKINVQTDKVDEFVRNLHSLWLGFLREDGCSSYCIYREFEKDNIFFIVGEYDTSEAMTKHFQTDSFEVLLGAARVLGKVVSMSIAEVSEKGGYDLAKSKNSGGR
jgi:quinol monooxygenase YgiN